MLNTLNVAHSGLNVSKVQVEGVMNNLANENTAGYKTRVVDAAELEHLDSRKTGRGVYVEGVSRITNDYMYQNLIEEQSKQTAFEQLDIMLEDIESIFYETDDSGLSADLNRYFQSIENLRTSPQNEIYKNDLKNNGEILVDKLQTLYTDIEDLEEKSLQQAYAMVDDVNNKLNKIGELSQTILNSSEVQNDLFDRRDMLEQELAEYIDVDISRDATYQLDVGGKTAVRYDTNIHALNLTETYIAQKDVYAQYNTTTGNIDSTLIPTSWGTLANAANNIAEVQTINITGTATGQISFLGTYVANADGTIGHRTSSEIASDIAADPDVITNWNNLNPNKEIDTITASGSALTITYKSTEGDAPLIDAKSSNGINFSYSIEDTKGAADIVTYRLNNELEVNVAYGETINNVPIGTLPETYESITVDSTNVIRALTHKINSHPDLLGKVTAYNGPYEVDSDGNKILTNHTTLNGQENTHSDYDPLDPNKDRYLIIESTLEGETGSFIGEIVVQNAKTSNQTVRSQVEKSDEYSVNAADDIHLEIFDEEVVLNSGKLKSILDNIKTDSGENKFQVYKERLDQFAKALSDISGSFIETSKDQYVYGNNAVDIHSSNDEKVEIDLFDGADVKSLVFNTDKIISLNQEKLDYLASTQWNEDIDFDGTGERNTSFSNFYQTLRVEIADDRENVIFRRESQDAITESLNNTYDKLTKVDKDKEMVDLIKFQSAYEANAKLITIVDEMLQTILGMKR